MIDAKASDVKDAVNEKGNVDVEDRVYDLAFKDTEDYERISED